MKNILAFLCNIFSFKLCKHSVQSIRCGSGITKAKLVVHCSSFVDHHVSQMRTLIEYGLKAKASSSNSNFVNYVPVNLERSSPDDASE